MPVLSNERIFKVTFGPMPYICALCRQSTYPQEGGVSGRTYTLNPDTQNLNPNFQVVDQGGPRKDSIDLLGIRV